MAEDTLDALLAQRETLPDDDFVLQVMRRTGAERRRRRAILAVSGLLGGGCAALGATLLAGPITDLFSGLPPTAMMQGALLACGAAALYAWFMGDDLGVSG